MATGGSSSVWNVWKQAHNTSQLVHLVQLLQQRDLIFHMDLGGHMFKKPSHMLICSHFTNIGNGALAKSDLGVYRRTTEALLDYLNDSKRCPLNGWFSRSGCSLSWRASWGALLVRCKIEKKNTKRPLQQARWVGLNDIRYLETHTYCMWLRFDIERIVHQ